MDLTWAGHIMGTVLEQIAYGHEDKYKVTIIFKLKCNKSQIGQGRRRSFQHFHGGNFMSLVVVRPFLCTLNIKNRSSEPP